MDTVGTTAKTQDLVTELAASRRKMQAHQARQRGIRPEFALLTAELTQELLGWARHFERIEGLLAGYDAGTRASLEADVRQREGPAFLAAFESGLERLTAAVRDFGRDDHSRHAFYFRNQMWPFSAKVPVMRRCLLQPRGYPGDSGLMQMMYDARYEGDSLMAQLMHWHAIHVPAADAVRNRRQLVANHAAHIADTVAPAAARVLSVACGPAAELQHILAPTPAPRRFEFVLMDQDRLALAEARASLAQARSRGAAEVPVQAVQLSALDVVNNAAEAHKLGAFDFIYSMGLFDYLPTDFARQLAAALYTRLRPGGTILLGNYHVSNPHQVYMQYWCDWKLTYRTEADMLELLRDVSPEAVEVGFEASGTQMFLRARAA